MLHTAKPSAEFFGKASFEQRLIQGPARATSTASGEKLVSHAPEDICGLVCDGRGGCTAQGKQAEGVLRVVGGGHELHVARRADIKLTLPSIYTSVA